ncbi:MAG TPA: DUF4386 domain-containing protein [Anaerolineales bacterium]|nr:DUF4386 domain-containing protein [Anaerolineales bacterium]
MTSRTASLGTSPLVTARIAGLLYLLVVPLGIFGSLYVPSKLIVPGDAASTARNLMTSESLFRFAIVSDLLAPLVLIFVVLFLYKLLKPVDKNMASLMVIFLLLGVPIALLSKVNQFIALQLLSGADYLTVFTAEQLQALAYLFLRLHDRAGTFAAVFWGLWLFPMGYLVFKSGFFPKILGILLMISCFGYLINSFAIFLGYNVNTGLFGAVGEVLFILWLLIRGVNAEQWQRRALDAASA